MADHSVQLATSPTVSPDGSEVVYVSRGDLWAVSAEGGSARRLTAHPSEDSDPHFSPDGQSIAFSSSRSGSRQVYVMPANGGEPKQLTWHTEGSTVEDWYPDGQSVLISGARDHFWRSAGRLFQISVSERQAERLLFDDYASEGSVSPDGTRVLFVREGERWWRKGYEGARAAQIWLHDSGENSFRKLVHLDSDSRTPVWLPDGTGFLYCTSQGAGNGARNLWMYVLDTKESVQLTHFDDDLVTEPTVSRDGSTIVFSHLFDLYRLQPGKSPQPRKILITESSDSRPDPVLRRTLDSASDAAFTSDGLEIAIVAGGDLWVMETELREPVRITTSGWFETDPVFSKDNQSLFAVVWQNGQADLCRIQRSDASKYWWQNTSFQIEKLTDDAAVESSLVLSPDGKQIAYLRERGDLWIRELETGDARSLVNSFLPVAFDFSPDGKWIVYSKSDDDFNSDIWIMPVDKSAEPVNLSRHPDDESDPKWSPDGKLIAFTGRRSDDEVDIYYVWLTDEDDETTSRDRRLKKTLEALEKARKKSSGSRTEPEKKGSSSGNGEAPDKPADSTDSKPDTASTTDATLPEVKIDFTDIHRRLKHISIEHSSERGLSWSPDSRQLVFSATIRGESGTYSVEFPDQLTPKKLTSSTGTVKRWLSSPSRMLWLSSGKPGVQPLSGSAETYAFNARQAVDIADRHRAGFETAWRIMRDWWYDDNYGNHNWDQIRRKYSDVAAQASTAEELARVVELMLGELNGSHLGFGVRSDRSAGSDERWQPETAHLGIRFETGFNGPGLRVRDVIPEGPATEPDSRIEAGEIILTIDGQEVDSAMDLTLVLNGPLDRDISLRVRGKGKDASERDVVLRPVSFGTARSLLYQKWQDDNRALVGRRAPNMGYLHIRGMDWPSFLDFERELYEVGYGKEGLIIDVRDNGGGFTTDHLLTALTQPRHAITVSRGGGRGYPQSRMVYATWDKPIVVLCNQNSYSNAEIFSHAIKGLNRGKLVGVPTAGGVVSTGSEPVMDLGGLRLPFRGWFVKWTGQDMELNGAVPHVIVWPQPTEMPSGKDRQLNRAIQVLKQEIEVWQQQPSPTLIKATEREKKK
ncbi:MAG: PD40 domain-containing protein [Planctomycetaceae bacterium]|nr:PD40 domain-containing protein [Planctomycetaceae bacterium]